jgi:endonuclease YncB( thermonuclease family)
VWFRRTLSPERQQREHIEAGKIAEQWRIRYKAEGQGMNTFEIWYHIGGSKQWIIIEAENTKDAIDQFRSVMANSGAIIVSIKNTTPVPRRGMNRVWIGHYYGRGNMKTLVLATIFAGVSLAASAAHYSPAVAIDKTTIRVIDGDTIAVAGTTVRIVGLNAPETHHVCVAELKLGAEAKQYAMAMVAKAGAITMQTEIHAKTGTILRDKYGRLLGLISIDGRDWASLMISANLAKAWNGKGRRPGWC